MGSKQINLCIFYALPVHLYTTAAGVQAFQFLCTFDALVHFNCPSTWGVQVVNNLVHKVHFQVVCKACVCEWKSQFPSCNGHYSFYCCASSGWHWSSYGCELIFNATNSMQDDAHIHFGAKWSLGGFLHCLYRRSQLHPVLSYVSPIWFKTGQLLHPRDASQYLNFIIDLIHNCLAI